jgi:quercetin dioxygenase-like cupin family protein
MRTAQLADAAPGFSSPHRRGGVNFTRLLNGTPGAPDNFEFSRLTVSPEYGTPRHHHNFDQIHFVLRGRNSLSRDRWSPERSVTYYPEGAFYGPQDGGDCDMISLQLGGPTGSGFLDYSTLRAKSEELATLGRFEDGVYVETLPDGSEHRRDGYEAAWERATGSPVVYPPGRFAQPNVMMVDAFRYVPSASEPGVELKLLGVLNERRTTVRFVQIDAGATHVMRNEQQKIVAYVLHGSFSNAALQQDTAFALDPGEAIQLHANTQAELYVVDLPDFSS